jgi:protein involved in polysaccharide export with SLBB domain
MLLSGSFVLGCKKAEEGKSQQASPNDAAAAESVADSAKTHPSTQPGRIGPGDLLLIDVSDLSGPNTIDAKPVRVGADGPVRLYYVTQPVPLAGMTTADAEKAIVPFYRKAGLLQQANVYVRRIQVAADGGLVPKPIAPFDLIRISAWWTQGRGLYDLRITRVDAEGNVSLAFGEKRKLSGLTEAQAEEKLPAAYGEANEVLVSVLRLEAAPPGAEKTDRPDAPIHTVPEVLKPLFWAGWPSPSPIPVPGKK